MAPRPRGAFWQYNPRDGGKLEAVVGGTIVATINQYGIVSSSGINVKDFGARGDGITDDTDAIQRAEDFATALITANPDDPRSGVIFFPRGTYLATNITRKRGRWYGADRWSTFIEATPTAPDTRYLVANESWLTPGSQYADSSHSCHEITIDAGEYRDFAYVNRSYFSTFGGLHVRGGTDTDFLISTNAADGTAHAGTMVNCTYDDCWFGFNSGVTQYNVRLEDTARKATDHRMTNCLFSGSTVNNCDLGHQTAGWIITANHFYAAPINLKVGKPNVGTNVTNNYFEENVILGSADAGYQPIAIGPGNYFRGIVIADFANNGEALDQIVLQANVYGPNGKLRHNWNGATKQLVSANETFKSQAPFEFYSGGNIQNSSIGIILVQDATLLNVGWKVTAAFCGPSSNSATHPRIPADLVTNPLYAVYGTAGWHNKIGRLSSGMTAKAAASGNAALSLVVSVPALADNGGFEAEVSVGQRLDHSSTVRTAFVRRYSVVKKPDDHAYYFTPVYESYTAEQWTVAPDISAADANGLCTITFTGTPATTDGHGTAILKVGGFLS